MEIAGYYFSKLQTTCLVVLILGLLVGLVLVQREQVVKSLAVNVGTDFALYENPASPRPVSCQGETCTTEEDVLIYKVQGMSNRPTSPVEAAVIKPSSIADCKFRRSDSMPDASIRSELLLNFIQEASQKATIPQVVLAAFLRVESAGTFYWSDEEIKTYSSRCAVSKTGALGIMQLQPPNTYSEEGDPAWCDSCLKAGARLIGKDTLTTADYCDPRSSIIVGAKWILEKMRLQGFGDGNAWLPEWTGEKTAIRSMVKSYYGDELYPPKIRKYSYVEDVWYSIQNCKTGQ